MHARVKGLKLVERSQYRDKEGKEDGCCMRERSEAMHAHPSGGVARKGIRKNRNI